MKDIFPKWIIQGDTLIIGKVTFHKELVWDSPLRVRGGGLFHYDRDTSSFYLYGTSHDFKSATREDVVKCIEQGNVGDYLGDDSMGGYNFYFSTSDTLSEALKETKRIYKL